MRLASSFAVGAASRLSLLLLLLLLLLAAPCHAAFLAHGAAALDFAGDDALYQAYPGLAPRFLLDSMPPIVRRDSSSCNSGHHSCLDINSTLCCPNDRYCMVDPTTFAATCCSIGLNCSSPCDETMYECNVTTTVTQKQTELVSGTATLALTSANTKTAAGSTLKTITATITTTSVHLACCPRRCPATSKFLCESSFGGGCCEYGQKCGSSSNCLWISTGPTAAPTASGTALISALPSGCTTGQISCASSLGGGCCATGHTCTVVSDQVYCAQASGVTNSTTVGGGGSKLSAGAKAGISIGVVLGAGALIGSATWILIRRRRLHSASGSSRRASALPPPSFATHEYDDLQQSPRQDPQMYQQSVGGGGGGGAVPVSAVASSPGASAWRNPSFFRRNTGNNGSPATPGMPTASERGATQDYFGPVGVPGALAEPTSAMSPHGLRDTVAPVEIDSIQRNVNDGTPASGMPGNQTPANDPNDEKYAFGQGQQAQDPPPPPAELPQPQQHFELYGSEVPVPAPPAAADAVDTQAAGESPMETAETEATEATEVAEATEARPTEAMDCDSPTVPRTPHPLRTVESQEESS